MHAGMYVSDSSTKQRMYLLLHVGECSSAMRVQPLEHRCVRTMLLLGTLCGTAVSLLTPEAQAVLVVADAGAMFTHTICSEQHG